MSVLVAALVSEPQPSGPPAAREVARLSLSRVPCAFEFIELGGETLRVVSVRHLSGDVAAELHCERLPAQLQPMPELVTREPP